MSALVDVRSSDRLRAALLDRVRLRARRYACWARHLWEQGATSAGQGLAITHGEVDRLLLDPGVLAAAEQRFYREDEVGRALSAEVAQSEQTLIAESLFEDGPWTRLLRAFALSPYEADLLTLAWAVEADPGLRRVCAYLHDDVQAQYASPWLAARLFEWEREAEPDARAHASGSLRDVDARGHSPSWRSDAADAVAADPAAAAPAAHGPGSSLVRWRLARPADSVPNPWGALAPWSIDPAVFLFLHDGVWRDPALGDVVETRPNAATTAAARPQAFPEAFAATRDFMTNVPTPIVIELIGADRSGRRTFATQIAALTGLAGPGRDLCVADAAALFAATPPDLAMDRLIRVIRWTRVARAIPYWHAADQMPDALFAQALALADVTIAGRAAANRQPPPHGIVRHSVTLGTVSAAAAEAIWRHLRHEPLPLPLRERALTAGEVVSLATTAAAGTDAVRSAARMLVHPPNDLLQPLPCPYDWNDLVLTPDVRRQLSELEAQARLRGPVYDEWGFRRLCPLGRGITALFAGPSGTGKTMAAQVIARALDRDLYRVDLAGVINKYIGETEKRLKQLFDHCERAHVVLFFDEADALFGQRMQVKEAHDRFANIEIDYLLQRMEQFDGMAVLATNRKSDLDAAFLRRLRFVVDFLPPGPEERLRLWKAALHERSPGGEPLLDTIDWTFLAEKLPFTGADIKNAALGAAFLARDAGTRIGMSQLVRAARRELTKHGVVLRTTLWEGD